jgi:hypothetical protein
MLAEVRTDRWRRCAFGSARPEAEGTRDATSARDTKLRLAKLDRRRASRAVDGVRESATSKGQLDSTGLGRRCGGRCDLAALWRGAAALAHLPHRKCRRHRRCLGEPAACLLRALPSVSHAQQLEAAKAVMASGPRRIPPATQFEWKVRREPLPALMQWQMTSADGDEPRAAGPVLGSIHREQHSVTACQ